MEFQSIQDAEIKKGARVIVRADFDVTVREGVVEDDFRIREAAKTLKFIAEKGGFLRIIAHRGRPGGKPAPEFSFKALLPVIKKYFEEDFLFIDDPFIKTVKEEFMHVPRHMFFENIRFWPEEEANEENFAKELAGWGDIYVNEAFAVSHRKHASIVSLPLYLPSYGGFRFVQEVAVLSRVLENPERPLVAVLGGEKIETKLALVDIFLKKGDAVLVGGTLMNTLFAARGVSVGKSAVDRDFLEHPNRFVLMHPHLFLPHDAVLAKSAEGEPRVGRVEDVAADEIIFDIGPESTAAFAQIIAKAKTVVWNGPMGQAELRKFAEGTVGIAKSIQEVHGLTVVGGGHTISALHAYGLTDNITHISTGGGAMLEFLAGKKLPGVETLKMKN